MQLNSRTEIYCSESAWEGFTESFTFDNLNRLEASSINGVEKMRMVYTTDGTNNQIWSKTSVGSEFQYNYGNGYPVNNKLREFSEAKDYMPNSHEITYISRLKTASITKHVDTTQSRVLEITYGPDQQRWKSSLKKNNALTRTVLYADDYEVVTENGVSRQLYYISVEYRPTAIYVGQTCSIMKLVDGNGTEVFKASYDVWGKQTVTNNTFAFHRGYTGHERLPEFKLINMNGRMYDPILGRFLSPDPYAQAPDWSQSFNRYSYCLNNPLKYT
jgi:RHS repeat-associated protein